MLNNDDDNGGDYNDGDLDGGCGDVLIDVDGYNNGDNGAKWFDDDGGGGDHDVDNGDECSW